MNLKNEVLQLKQKRHMEEVAQRQEEEERRAAIAARIAAAERQIERLFVEAREILWDDEWEVSLRSGWENLLHTSYVWRMTAERRETKGLLIHRVVKVDTEELAIYFAPEARKYPFSSPRLSYFTQAGLKEEVARQVLDLLEQRQKHAVPA